MSHQNPGPYAQPQGQPATQVPGEAPGHPPAQSPGQPPAPGAPPPQQPPAPDQRRSWFARHKILTVLLAVVAFFVVVGIATSGGDDDAPASEETGTSEDAAAADEADDDGAADDAATEDAADADEAAEEGSAEVDEAEEVPEEESAPGLGDTVADGDFEFVVTEVETGVERIGDEFLNADAQGGFVLVHMTVTNTGDSAQTFSGSNQDLIDTEGRTHSADSSAAIYLQDSDSFLNQINPGNTVEGIVVFDIPADAEPASIELHDSAFSGGASVDLG